MRFLNLLLLDIDAALDWQLEDPLLAEHEPPQSSRPAWTAAPTD